MFCGPDGGGGNALGVVRDGAALPGADARAAELGFSETVFLDDAVRGILTRTHPDGTIAVGGRVRRANP